MSKITHLGGNPVRDIPNEVGFKLILHKAFPGGFKASFLCIVQKNEFGQHHLQLEDDAQPIDLSNATGWNAR